MAVLKRPFACVRFTRCYNFFALIGRVAQLVRAFGSHPRGRWFESNRAHFLQTFGEAAGNDGQFNSTQIGLIWRQAITLRPTCRK